MDEINEKAIKDIIDYYDKEKVHEEEIPDENHVSSGADSENTEEDRPNLIQLIEGAKEKEEESEQAEALAENKEEEEPSDEEPEIKENENKSEKMSDQSSDGKKEISVITPVYDLSNLEENDESDEYHIGKKQIWIAASITFVIAVLVVIFITVDTGFIKRYKQNFSHNITAVFARFGIDISSHDTGERVDAEDVKETEKHGAKNIVTVPMETAGRSVFTDYRNGLICAYTNYLSLISDDGSTIWENATTIVDPILKTAGNYILIAEKNGKKICLYNDSKLVYEADTEDNVLTCSVSSNGDVVAVTDKPAYKGAIVVYNREGNQIFAWSSGNDNVISADISAASRRVAVALLNTDEKVKSTIQLFDMKEEKSYAQAIFEDTILFNIDFIGDTVDAFGDNCIAGITSQGELIYDKRFDGAEFVHYGIDGEGNKILLFDNADIPLINIYNANASLKHQISSDELPDFVDICGRYIVFNNGRDIIYGKSGKRQLAKYTASMDIKELVMLDDSTFVVVYSNNIEIVRM